MIYTDLTIKAMNIAYKAHLNQMDKSGSPYIFHPIHLAEQCDDEISCATALLHDVVEIVEVWICLGVLVVWSPSKFSRQEVC